MKIVLLFFTCLLTGSLNAQSNANDEIESIGFAYGASAGRSHIFMQVEKYLNDKEYDQIVKLLKSEKASEVFVGSLVCKILLEKNKISLNTKQAERLNENFNSQLILSICSGCTCSMKVTVEELFNGVDGCNFGYALEEWLSELFH